MTKIYTGADRPWQLLDAAERCVAGQLVYGFELELLADFVSR